MWLILAAQPAEPGSNLVPLYYIFSIIAVIITGLWALKKYNDRQQEKWISKGKQEQDLADKLEANAEATVKATAAVEKLAGVIDRMNAQLNGHDKRIEKLEEYATFGNAPYRRHSGN